MINNEKFYPVQFIGAGPGAEDLITLRGAKLIGQADLVIYAGSLVNEKILDLAPKSAVFQNSAKMSLPEVISSIKEYYFEHKRVVRLHTGDPAMYGAVSEQYRELDTLNIEYEVTPGVSSVFAAAAVLKVELTMPNVSQTVILTRDAGRTPVPEDEEIRKLAQHNTTICLFLSISNLELLVEKLLVAGRKITTPVAVVYRATWENQKIVRGTLENICNLIEENDIKRQAMIIIGDVLKRDGELSKLYDENFSTGYRSAKNVSDEFTQKVACFALTKEAAFKASEIASGLDNADVYVAEKYQDAVPIIRRKVFANGEFGKTFAKVWKDYAGFVMVMASGIVVRHLATLCDDKKSDPAVVTIDETGNYAVSLLSGHTGQANILAQNVARITGGKSVISTASDIRKLPAFDSFAKKYHYDIVNPEIFNKFASLVLENKLIEMEMNLELFNCEFNHKNFILKHECNLNNICATIDDLTLNLKKQFLVLGIGCKRDTAMEVIEKSVNKVLNEYGYKIEEISLITSATVKKNEIGLLDFAKKYNKEITFFDADKLNNIEVLNPSCPAKEKLEINSVSEASAKIGAGENSVIVIEKVACDRQVTVALARRVK